MDGYTLRTRKNEDLIPYLQMHHSCSLQSLSDVLAWQYNYTKHVTVIITLPVSNLKTRSEMKTRFGIPGFRVSINSRLCQMRWHHKAILKMTSLWLSCDLFTIYRADTKWWSDLVFQVLELILTSNFIRCISISKWLYKWHNLDGHVAWLQFINQIQNKDQILYL